MPLKRKIKLEEIASVVMNDMKITRNDSIMVFINNLGVKITDAVTDDLVYLLKMIVGTGGTLILIPAGGTSYPVAEYSKMIVWGRLADSFPSVQHSDLTENDSEIIIKWLGETKTSLIGIGLDPGDIFRANNALSFSTQELRSFNRSGISFFCIGWEKAHNP